MDIFKYIVLSFLLGLGSSIVQGSYDECTSGSITCSPHASCQDGNLEMNGTADCFCDAGYTGNGTHCQDIDECEMGPCNDTNAGCENTGGSFLCICGRNFREKDGKCQDIDECSENTHTCTGNTTCVNVPGGFNCSCNPGFSENGGKCQDVDECTEGLHKCHPNATCVNLSGSYSCACNADVLPEQTCQAASFCRITATDVDECLNKTLNDCHKDAVCTNFLGSYLCTCKSGFTGDGKTCSEEDDDDDLIIALASVAIALLALCLVVLVITLVCIYKMKSRKSVDE